MFYDQKMILSGKTVEFFIYQKPIFRKESEKKHKKNILKLLESLKMIDPVVKEEHKSLSYDSSLKRAKQNLTRIISCNRDFKTFITLTFAQPTVKISEANKELKKFIQRIKYELDYELKYIAVPEYQKDVDFYGRSKDLGGSVHYHLISNIPYMPNSELRFIWRNGFVSISKIRSLTGVSVYVQKYLKKFKDIDWVSSKKRYFTSKNIQRPFEKYGNDVKDYFLNNTENLILKYATIYPTDYRGIIRKWVYKVSSDK